MAGCSQSPPGGEDSGSDATGPASIPSATKIIQAGEKAMLSHPASMASEFWVERDPSDPMRLVVGRLEFTDPQTWTCMFARSTDGGRTWQELPRVFGSVSSDPWVAWAPDGTLHVVCNASNYARSHDDGDTWEEQPRPETPGNDRPSILVDGTGRLFHCSTRPSTNEGPTIIYSDDNGDSWTQTPFTSFDADWENTICNAMEAGPDGTLYAALGLSMFRIAVSTDGGENWAERASISPNDPRRANYGTTVPTHREGNMFPSFTVSPTTGHVFVGIQQYDEAANLGIGAFGLELHRSSDQGATFEKLAWPTAPAACDRCDVTRAIVHVDDVGRLGVIWRTSELSLPFQTWFSVSLDEGATWLPPILLSTEEPTQTAIPYRSIDGADHYWNMASSPEGFVAFWIDRTADGYSGLWTQILSLE